jgi:serine/threonine-protein kinase
MLKAGDRIGEWVVERSLGEGGMGAVYRVHSALSRRVVAALKVMKPTLEPDAHSRFVREAEALSALRHPAIVHVMGFSEDPARGIPYIVMELAVGETLKERLEKGALPVAQVVSTFAVLAAALDHAHGAGVYHRDIKPANVILVPDGTVRLVDFGIAAAHAEDNLHTSGHLGTLSYLPPEVFRGQPADPARIDVYAFGLLLYESVTGTRAFPVEPGLTPPAAAAAVGVRKLQQAALDAGPQAPERLRDIVRRATDPEPEGRPSMREVREALDALRDRRSVSPAAHPPWAETSLRGAAGSAPDAGPPEDHTTRVPDPTQRFAAAAPRRRRLPAGQALPWVGLVLLLAGGLLAALASRDGAGSRRDARAAGPADEPSGAPTRAPSRAPAFSAQPAPPLPPPSARPSLPPPASPLPSLSPPPAPSPVPSPRPSPSPSAQASPSPSPVQVAARPPAAEPAEEAASGADEEAGADESEAVAAALGGRWDLVNEVGSTTHPAFQGLRLGYRLRLRQAGSRITGDGEKVSENGVLLLPSQRTPITVSGTVEGSQVVLRFTEQGDERASAGVFRWRLSPDGNSLEGGFSSDVASSRGSSVASRVQ